MTLTMFQTPTPRMRTPPSFPSLAGLDRVRARAARRRAATGLRGLLRQPHAQDGIHAQVVGGGRVPFIDFSTFMVNFFYLLRN